MAVDSPDRCATCGGLHVPTVAEALSFERHDRLPVLCLCEPCCAETVHVAARLLDELALEQAEVVRARIAGIAERLRASGVVLRAVDIPQSNRAVILSCAATN